MSYTGQFFISLNMLLFHSVICDPLLGFVGDHVHTRGYVGLLTTFGTSKAHRTLIDRYVLVEVNTSYNTLIG